MAGRTLVKHSRVYYAGYDLSSNVSKWGELGVESQEVDLSAIADPFKGLLPGQATLKAGPINGILDNTAIVGAHTILNGLDGTRQVLTVALGDRAAPVVGDVCFATEVWQRNYRGQDQGGGVFFTLLVSPLPVTAQAGLTIATPWGTLLNPNLARTAPNAGAGVDNLAQAVSTVFGGTLFYQVLAGNGTATLSVDDSADNAAFNALAGATTGSINCAVVGNGAIALSRTATVRRYLRWQLALGTATTVTFVLAFCRNWF